MQEGETGGRFKVHTLNQLSWKTYQRVVLISFVRRWRFAITVPGSVNTYAGFIGAMSARLKLPAEQITLDAFKEYLHVLISVEKRSVALINQAISAYKILQVDVLKRQWEDFKVKRPRRDKKLPVVLSLDEVERLLNVTRNVKHKAILMLAYSAGLRKSEVLNITPAAIDSGRMQVRVVQGKGRKDRYSILSATTLDLLRVYYKIVRPKHFLFESWAAAARPFLSVRWIIS